MKLLYPVFLLLWLIIPVYWFLKTRFKDAWAFNLFITDVPSSLRVLFIWITDVILLLAFAILVVALARPQKGVEKEVQYTEGIAIELVIDRSGSMATPMSRSGRRTRLEVVKEVITHFVMGDDSGLEGRPNDMVGIVTFATHADTLCPLTLSRDVLPGFIQSIEIFDSEESSSTAIGDALALAAARLYTMEEGPVDENGQADYSVKSKVIILLTDGDNNAGNRSPIEAAQLAAEWDIKVYPIGIIRNRLLFNGTEMQVLQQIAEITGGKAYTANNPQALYEVYQEIDTLEKSLLDQEKYTDYKEVFMPFLIVGMCLFLLCFLLRITWLRSLP